ncbi:MAG: hypothetical protein K6G10_10365 [Butyrivibrio sp.]|nr:hypothetical protein [Butyrivibrio sp.]
MKKRFIAAAAAVIAAVLAGCGGGTYEIDASQIETISVPVVEGQELMCLAENKEEAQKIADMYGIELVDFGYGVATFHTEDDPQSVISAGLEKGYPELSINGYSHTFN